MAALILVGMVAFSARTVFSFGTTSAWVLHPQKVRYTLAQTPAAPEFQAKMQRMEASAINAPRRDAS